MASLVIGPPVVDDRWSQF